METDEMILFCGKEGLPWTYAQNSHNLVDGNTHKSAFSFFDFCENRLKFAVHFKGNPTSDGWCLSPVSAINACTGCWWRECSSVSPPRLWKRSSYSNSHKPLLITTWSPWEKRRRCSTYWPNTSAANMGQKRKTTWQLNGKHKWHESTRLCVFSPHVNQHPMADPLSCEIFKMGHPSALLGSKKGPSLAGGQTRRRWQRPSCRCVWKVALVVR